MTLQVFISYKSEYRDFARAVKSELNQWGFNTWLDVDNIQPGDYFRHKIQAGLDSSDVLLMVLTEEAQLSREVMSEVDYFLDVAKKPVVPLRHRECKPLYIFVSIQYIDFVADQVNGFVQLKQRLSELAQSTVDSMSGDAPTLEPMREEAQKPGAATPIPEPFGVPVDAKTEQEISSDFFSDVLNTPASSEQEKKTSQQEEADEAVLDDFLKEKSDPRKEAVEDGLFGAPALSPAEAPMPQPAPPPKPIIQPPSSPITAPSAPPLQQPLRQTETMPQPAAMGQRKSSPLLWPVAAVASFIVVVGAVILFSSNATISITGQPQGTSPLVWVGVLAAAGVIGIFGWRRFARPKTSAVPSSTPAEDAQNHATMLQNVEDFWLKGVLDPALEAGTFEMGLSSAPGAVLRHKDYGDYELPANANILDVFNDLNRELLILGAPGGGKTVLLLQLAKALIEQAKNPTPQSPPRKQGGEEPIPVVFNLSSWAAERKPLASWLMDELRQKYQVPKKVATAWVEGEKLLLLLDGLDEVAEQYRNECVDAINAFRQQYRTVDLAICSRVMDYEALTSKLDVRGAIVLEPLSQKVIDRYLDRPELASLRQVMKTDQELQEMSQVPFLLNAMAYAYVRATHIDLEFPTNDDAAKVRRTHLFKRWVEKRLVAKPNAQYIQSKVQKWLGWLSEKIVTFKKIVFYIEELQPHWLTRNRRLYRIGLGLIVGLPFGSLFGLLVRLFGLTFEPKFRLAFGMAVGPIFDPKFGLMSGVLFGLIVALGSGLIFGLGFSLIITPAETLELRFNRIGLMVAVGTGIVLGLLFGLRYGLIFGLLFGIVSGIAFGIASGLRNRESVMKRSRPNQGIKQSVYNALRIMLPFGLGFGMIFGLKFGLTVGWAFGLVFGMIFGWVFGGGLMVCKHIVLRIILWRNGDAPWNYARFLNYCVSAGIMRKVGGGYIFAHRYLMEYFAESYQEESK